MILGRASRHYLRRHPWLLSLSILGVALGVAVVVAVDLANESARRGFLLSVEALSGRATHEIVGGPRGLPEVVYRNLRVKQGVRLSAPVVEGYARTAGPAGQTFKILGIDPFAEGHFRALIGARESRVDVTRLLTQSASVLLTPGAARRLGLGRGDTLKLRIGSAWRRVTIVGLLAVPDPVAQQAFDSVLVTDIATAQELLNMVGRLSRIDLIIGENRGDLMRRVRAVLPPGAQIVRAAHRSQVLDQMTRAFRVNLTALSLLALMVGMFLIYNIMTFTVVQRRVLIGTLRALGVTRRQLYVLVIVEALVIGLIGTAIGTTLGVLLAKGLVGRVVQTINDLYFVLSVTSITLVPASFFKGIALGLGATVVAALAPAWEATRTEVAAVLRRSTIETRSRRRAYLAAVYGTALAVVASAILLVPSRSLLLSYTGLFAVMIAFALLVPLLTLALMRLCRPIMGRIFGVIGEMAAGAVAAKLSRTGTAIAALAVAVSATIGVGIMIDSFRQSFIDWLTLTLRADVYVTAPVIETAPAAATLDPALVARLAALPGVSAISTLRRVRLDGPGGGVVQLRVLHTTARHFEALQFKRGNARDAWKALQDSDAVIVSEPYAYHHRLRLGDKITLRTDDGVRAFGVAGIYYDYGSDEGRVTISRRIYERYWRDRAITSIALYAAHLTDINDLLTRVRAAAGAEQVLIRSNRALRRASLEVFDRTFAITAILRLLATVVAFIGVLSALMALQLERGRELAVLRAIGLTPRQVWRLVTTETGLMGLTSGLLALPLGIGLALALILVINRRAFGWSLQVSIEPTLLLEGLALALVAALLAGLYPALRMASAPPALALRTE
jgi:putative ABC transport system permease protein